MKTIAITVTIVLFVFPSLFAQEQTNPRIPTGKDFMLEINMTPFTGDDIFVIDQLKGRYYFNEHWAIRLGVMFDFKTDKSNLDAEELEVGPDNPREEAYEKKSTTIGFMPGFEYRILANSKVAPYVGAEFLYQSKSSSSSGVRRTYDAFGWEPEVYTSKSEIDVDGAWFNYYDYSFLSIDYDTRSFNKIGGNLFIGSDFYFVKNFYFGIELGLGLHSTKFKDVTIDTFSATYYPEGAVDVESDTEVIHGSSDFITEFYIINAIRVGVWF